MPPKPRTPSRRKKNQLVSTNASVRSRRRSVQMLDGPASRLTRKRVRPGEGSRLVSFAMEYFSCFLSQRFQIFIVYSLFTVFITSSRAGRSAVDLSAPGSTLAMATGSQSLNDDFNPCLLRLEVATIYALVFFLFLYSLCFCYWWFCHAGSVGDFKRWA